MSLVEILVVLSLIAVVSGLALIQFGAGRGQALLDTDAQRVAVHVQTVSDKTLFSGADGTVEWQKNAVSSAIDGSAEVVLSLSDGVNIATPAGNHRFSSQGLSLPLTLVLEAEDTRRLVHFDGVRASVLLETSQ